MQFHHAVSVDSDTNETEIVTAQPDGTFQMDESSEPVRVQQGGSWVVTDSTLISGTDSLTPLAAAVPVAFSTGGDAPLAKIQTSSGQWLSQTWRAGPLPAPVVEGSTATYPNVYPGVDLRLSAIATGMSEVLVIKDAAAAVNPDLAEVGFGVDDGNLTATSTAGGTAVVTASDGSTQLTSTAATWWDSSSTGASADGPGGLGVPAPVAGTVSDSMLTIDAAAPTRTDGVTYPVYVDPDWTGGVLAWAFVDSAYPDQAYWKGAGASTAISTWATSTPRIAPTVRTTRPVRTG